MSMDSDHKILARLEQASSLEEVMEVYRFWLNWGDDDEVGDEIRQRISQLRAEEMKPPLEAKKQQDEAEWQSICEKIALRREQFIPSQFQPGQKVRCLIKDCKYSGRIGVVEGSINHLLVSVRFSDGYITTSDQRLALVNAP